MSNLPRNFAGVNLPSDRHKAIAEDVLSSYERGMPVVIIATDDKGVLHGLETLKTIALMEDRDYTLTVKTIFGMDRHEFEASDLPEFCEAARIVWLEDGFPKWRKGGA